MARMTAEDRLDVQDLIARYATWVDTGDVEGYVQQFLPSGVIEHRAGRCVGHDEIRPWVAGLVAEGRIGGDPAKMRHVLGLPVIEGDSERCSAKTYVVIPMIDEAGRIGVPLVGTYIDECVKVGDRWLFEKRIIQMDLIASATGDSLTALPANR